MLKKLSKVAVELLLIPRLRTIYCLVRWRLLRNRVIVYKGLKQENAEQVISYNMSAFNHRAAFGCGNRMVLLFTPLSQLVENKADTKVLIIGPRTEDDIYLSKAHGFSKTVGLDLFSYSRHILLGDAHQTQFDDNEFDIVVIGWVLAYSKNPSMMMKEAKRVLKPNGFLAVGWEYCEVGSESYKVRINSLNTAKDIEAVADLDVVYTYNPKSKRNHHKALILENKG